MAGFRTHALEKQGALVASAVLKGFLGRAGADSLLANVMVGRLRLHQAGHKTDTYHQPEWYFWSNLRRNNTIQDILEAISAALGYENDEKRIFTINNPWNGPPDGIERESKKYNAVLFGLPDLKDDLTEVRKLVSTYNNESDNNMDDSDIIK
uniref:Uncharacterized protein n=1 Tax=Romanomermis culicivorax TaxID=13658 RepID=A0A915IRY0_ROMCU